MPRRPTEDLEKYIIELVKKYLGEYLKKFKRFFTWFIALSVVAWVLLLVSLFLHCCRFF